MDEIKCTGLNLLYVDGEWIVRKIATNRGIFELEKNCESEEVQKLIVNMTGFLLEQVKQDVIDALQEEQQQE